MYERMLDRQISPTEEQIQKHLGQKAFECLYKMEDYLKTRYTLTAELKFPFGAAYGWGYKLSHKSSHLCYVFFEKGAYTVTIQIGDANAPAMEDMLSSLSAKAVSYWKNRYPCGKCGGWIHYRVTDDSELDDIYKLIQIKKKPIKIKELGNEYNL